MISKRSLELDAIRARLKNSRGKEFWRSLDELATSDAFDEMLWNEFPRQAAALPGALTRRNFVKLMGASLALAGLSGCGANNRIPERIVPYVEAPEGIIPGKPLYFATAMALGGVAIGLLVENHMGRPTKIEGNPDHPGSLGATDVFSQASILTLYDPDRSQAVTNQGRIRTFETFRSELQAALSAQRETGGAGLRVLSETVISPTLESQIAAFQEAFPEARWYQYEPLGRDNERAGARLAFGEEAHTVYRVDQANVILSLDADFLSATPGTVRYMFDWSERRRVRAGTDEMNRLYVVESMYTPTGAKADNRLPLRSSDVGALALALAAELGVEGVTGGALPEGVSSEWLAALVEDLRANEGASLVMVGEGQPPAVHALGHAINAALGNVGTTLYYTDPLTTDTTSQEESLQSLVNELNAGQVEVLLILGGNPVLTAPVDLNFARALQNAGLSAHLSLYEDETSNLCHWHIPAAHYLESWSDARAYDGTVSIIQPLIEPLYGGKTVHEIASYLGGRAGASPYDIVRGFWEAERPGGNFERFWRGALHDGVVPDTALPSKNVTLSADLASIVADLPPAEPGIEVVFRPDPTIYDGQFANNGWLQELPKPIIKLTWDNAALMSPNTAAQAGVGTNDVVELRYRDNVVRASVMVVPGHADNSVTVWVGHGRDRAGQVGNETGFNAYALRTTDAPWFGTGLTLAATGEEYTLATTQEHFTLDGREELVHAGTLEEFREHPEMSAGGHGDGEVLSLHPEYEYDGHRWGMVIDMTACTGCQSCVIACQAENNIPIVGKKEVLRNREMHWLRVDTYYTGDLDNPSAVSMPVPCMHCEKAPCEPVCPVAATVHDSSGINNMIYNRCIGTRYCSNNCPYKVRRFNFMEYVDDETPVLSLLRNPDVTVRSRGVMEKCTYCIQRINAARIEADKEGRPIGDGEVVTACQAVCPTRAIIFGDLNDPESEVAAAAEQPHNYALLAELGTQPRTTYLAAIQNPNSATEA